MAVALPFFPLYLRDLGLTGQQVSVVMSIAPFLHLGVPLWWGWVADRTRRTDRLLQLACLGSFVFYGPLIFVRSMPALMVVVAAHQAFAVAISGLSDTLALDRARHGEDYGRIRVWGSVSFMLACLLIAPVLAARGQRHGDPLVPILMTAFLGLTFLSSLTVRSNASRERPHARDVSVLLADRRFLFLIVVAPVHWACCSPYHAFFGILLRDRGLSETTIGHAFVVSVVGEMLALYFFRTLRERFSLPTLLAVSFGASALRFVFTGLAVSPAWLVGLQAAHALTFGLYWGAALAWLAECVPPQLRATGQTLYTACTLGIGNIVGMLGTGVIYDRTGSAAPAYVLAGCLEIVPLVLALSVGRRLAPRYDFSRGL